MKRIFNRLFTMIEVATLFAVVIVGVGNYAYASTTVPNTFTANTPAKAGEVNDNFNALATAIDTISLTPGPKGDKGDTGATGVTGATGSQGPAGSPDTANQVRDKFFSGTSCAGNSASDVMVKVGPLCVDKYEASVWSNANGTGTQYGSSGSSFNLTDYPAGFPLNGNWTTPVYAVSKQGVLPATSITWFQAQQACALSGKRLLTNAEWQMAAAGTPDPGTSDDGSTTCDTNSTNPANTGSRSACVSKWMVNDMVGNVWEWVADWMQGPDANGVANTWNPSAVFTSSATYGSDGIYGINEAFPSTDRFPAVLNRGGSWIDGPSAGVFALDASRGPSVASEVFGFRCAR
jgi:formylglycine-generating enzyme required for sulfatase activity